VEMMAELQAESPKTKLLIPKSGVVDKFWGMKSTSIHIVDFFTAKTKVKLPYRKEESNKPESEFCVA
jgi:hypothetical protein